MTVIVRPPSKTSIPFSGSYGPDDIEFYLKPIPVVATDVAEKEELIQSGTRHYSEMISHEGIPSEHYQRIYSDALDAGKERLGRDIAALAQHIFQNIPHPVTLVSLVRAGVPLGVLLNRALKELQSDVRHIGISIIRDRGVDAVALDRILTERPAEGVVFIDGWTGKGAIKRELVTSLRNYPSLEPRLVVLADPCGQAWLAATGDDWLIPSGILGATVSGLISRSILNQEIGAGEFHGCTLWEHLQSHDQSNAFLDTVWPHVKNFLPTATPATWTDNDRKRHQTASSRAIDAIAQRFAVTNLNRIKPGIAEATRAILRRVPERVFLRSSDDPDLTAIIHLAQNAGVEIEINQEISPYRAITLIRKIS